MCRACINCNHYKIGRPYACNDDYFEDEDDAICNIITDICTLNKNNFMIIDNPKEDWCIDYE